MPNRPKIPCHHPGCPELVESGSKYCKKHKRLHPEEVRSAGSRGYDRSWQKARRQYLESHPICVKCLEEGRYTKATVVDHIKPHRGNRQLFWDRNNWQALCKAHHDRKTFTEDINPEYRF